MVTSWIFIEIGNFFHEISFIIIILKILASKNVRGLSLKTSILQAIVFYCRYINIFFLNDAVHGHFILTLRKILYVVIATSMVYLIRFKKPYCESYKKEHDSINILYILIPCALLSPFFTPTKISVIDTLWTFSILLEPFVIIPQIFMLQKFANSDGSGNIENLTANYMGTLGLYRGFYLIRILERRFAHGGDPIINLMLLSSTAQTIIYADFLYFWFKAKLFSKQMSIPV